MLYINIYFAMILNDNTSGHMCDFFFQYRNLFILIWRTEKKNRRCCLIKANTRKNQLKMLTSNRQNKQNDRIYEEAEAAVSGNWRVIYIQVISLRCCQNHLLFLRQLYYFNMFWYEEKEKNNAFLNFQATYQNKVLKQLSVEWLGYMYRKALERLPSENSQKV